MLLDEKPTYSNEDELGFARINQSRRLTSKVYQAEVEHFFLEHRSFDAPLLTFIIGFLDKFGTLQQQILTGCFPGWGSQHLKLLVFKVPLYDKDKILKRLDLGMHVTLLEVEMPQQSTASISGRVLIVGNDGFVILIDNVDQENSNDSFNGKSAQNVSWNETLQHFGQPVSVSDRKTQKMLASASLVIATIGNPDTPDGSPLTHVIRCSSHFFDEPAADEFIILEGLQRGRNVSSTDLAAARPICLSYFNSIANTIIQVFGRLELIDTVLICDTEVQRSRNWFVKADSARSYDRFSIRSSQQGVQA